MNKRRLVGEREAGRQAAVGPQTLRLHGIPIFWLYDIPKRPSALTAGLERLRQQEAMSSLPEGGPVGTSIRFVQKSAHAGRSGWAETCTVLLP